MSAEIVGVSLTVAATAISIYNTILFSRQSKLVEKQALLQRSQVYPYVKVKEIQFEQNNITLTLENMSETPAFELGLLIRFTPCSELVNGYCKFVFPVEFPAGEPYFRKGYPKSSVSPLKNENRSNRLYGKETGKYSVEPSFLFRNSPKSNIFKKGSAWEFALFLDLKKRLLGQGIRYVAVNFALVYKDVAETLREYEQLGKFVVDLDKHDNLEQAKNEGIPFKDPQIDIKDMPMDFEVYNDLKSYRSSLEPPA